LDASRKTSNKGEKGEDGDEKKLETIPGKSEWVILLFDIVTGGFGFDSGSGGSGQESRDGLLLLALKDGKTIIEDSFLGLRSLAGLGCFLVVEVRDRFGVDGRVNEDGGDGLSSGSSGDLSSSELEVLGLFSERRVSLALWRRLRSRGTLQGERSLLGGSLLGGSLFDGLGGRGLSDSSGGELRGVKGSGRNQKQCENCGDLHC